MGWSEGRRQELEALCAMGQQQTRELPVEIGERYYCLDRKTLWDVCSGKNRVSDRTDRAQCE